MAQVETSQEEQGGDSLGSVAGLLAGAAPLLAAIFYPRRTALQKHFAPQFEEVVKKLGQTKGVSGRIADLHDSPGSVYISPEQFMPRSVVGADGVPMSSSSFGETTSGRGVPALFGPPGKDLIKRQIGPETQGEFARYFDASAKMPRQSNQVPVNWVTMDPEAMNYPPAAADILGHELGGHTWLHQTGMGKLPGIMEESSNRLREFDPQRSRALLDKVGPGGYSWGEMPEEAFSEIAAHFASKGTPYPEIERLLQLIRDAQDQRFQLAAAAKRKR